MYELIQVGKDTFYMDCPAKVGFFRLCREKVVLIDSGSDTDAGKKVKRILDEQNWQIQAIYNTHSHADHIGGNQYLQNLSGCRIYACGVESAFCEYPFLEPTVLYGGNPLGEMRNKFLMAKESRVEKLTEDRLPDGMDLIPLPGHSSEMVGFRTRDDVVFLADCLSSEETLQKYRIGYLFDVEKYLDTLEKVKTMQANCFVPSHAGQTANIAPLAQINVDKTLEIAGAIKKILSDAMCFDDLLAEVFRGFGLTMTLQQNLLLGSTVRSYLNYLYQSGQIRFFMENDHMLWQAN